MVLKTDLISRKRSAHLGATSTGLGTGTKSSSVSSSLSKDDHKKESRLAMEAVFAYLLVAILFTIFILCHRHSRVAVTRLFRRATQRRGSSSLSFLPPRYVTIVMPSVVNPKGRKRRLNSIAKTWGPPSRAIYVVHNLTAEFPQGESQVWSADDTQPMDLTSFPQVLQIPTHITDKDGLPRLELVIRYVHSKLNPDFVFFVNDHTYVIPDHVCHYLRDKDPFQDMYDGHALKNNKDDVFNSGAAGYFLSRRTMGRLVHSWNEKHPQCGGGKKNAWLQGNPGLVTARCLDQHLHVMARDTRESKKYHRFHAFPLVRMVMGKVDEWYRNKHKFADSRLSQLFDTSYQTLLAGPDCCAATTISFHYVEYKENECLFKIRRRLLNKPYMPDDELHALFRAEYPSEYKDVGGYSRLLPDDQDTTSWDGFLNVLRKTSKLKMEC